jgi:hypothetical protein
MAAPVTLLYADAEDAFWTAAGEGQRTKAQAKKEAESEKKAEAAARKAELKRLQEEEEAAMSRPKATAKATRVSGPKVGPYNSSSRSGRRQQQSRAARVSVQACLSCCRL